MAILFSRGSITYKVKMNDDALMEFSRIDCLKVESFWSCLECTCVLVHISLNKPYTCGFCFPRMYNGPSIAVLILWQKQVKEEEIPLGSEFRRFQDSMAGGQKNLNKLGLWKLRSSGSSGAERRFSLHFHIFQLGPHLMQWHCPHLRQFFSNGLIIPYHVLTGSLGDVLDQSPWCISNH